MGAIGRLGWIQVDCRDPAALATFWGTMLGMELDESLRQPSHYQGLVPVTVGHPVVSFQRVPEQKVVKNRLHFDVSVEDVEAATARVMELGGSRLPQGDFHEYGFSWRVMADPEGNEFCLIY